MRAVHNIYIYIYPINAYFVMLPRDYILPDSPTPSGLFQWHSGNQQSYDCPSFSEAVLDILDIDKCIKDIKTDNLLTAKQSVSLLS